MIGGIVRDVWIWGDEVELSVEDEGCYLGVRAEKNENSLCILRGDYVWWQGKRILWTPDNREFTDRYIPKVGYSYSFPDGQTITNGRAEFNRGASISNA